MASLITPQFERYIAEQTIAQGSVVFDEFIFANIPSLNENNLAQHLTMPTSAQIVHRQAVSQNGVINENSVVYSVTIGTEVGDFDFNFIGLINKSKNLLAVAVQTSPVKKTRNKNAVQGNSITRNILLEFSGAKALTGINVSANTWQIDFTVRLHGLDEKIRLTNRDLYGRAVFFDDGFLVKRKTGNQFTIQQGTAYVEGVRMDLTALYDITANNLPCSIYTDVVHHCTVTGAYETEIKYLTQSKADYVDTANRQHYVQILADIDSQGNVTDRRLLSPFLGMNPLTLDDTTENTKDKRGHTHKLPIASLVKRGIVKLFSGNDSDAEDMAATPKAIKGLKALIDSLTRNQGNYIPNSKKSSRVDSNSADDVATSAAVKQANDNANNRVPKAGNTTIIGSVRAQHENIANNKWSKYEWAAKKGVWRMEVNPDSHNENERRFNMVFTPDGGSDIYLWFPTIKNGDKVAYQSWAVNKAGDTLTGILRTVGIASSQFGHGSYVSQYTSGAPFMVDATGSKDRDTYHPFVKGLVRSRNHYGAAFSFGYTTKQGSGDGFGVGVINLIEDNGSNKNWGFHHNGDFQSAGDVKSSNGKSVNNSVQVSAISHLTSGTAKDKVASEFALNELNKRLSTVIRKNYTKTIKGTNPSFDNATQKNINLEGETIIHPDGKIEQIIHFKAFRVWWFYYENKNNSERLAIEIPVPLWTAMPNKITNVTAAFSRTESGKSFSFGAEAFEWWPPSWAFERQNNVKDRLWLYTIRHIGNQDEHIDLWVKVEGY